MRILDTPTHSITVIDGATIGPAPIRLITPASFVARFPEAVRAELRNSTDERIIDYFEDVKLRGYINLDDPRLSPGLAYLVANTSLTTPEAQAVLVDGTEDEAWEG